MEDLAGELILAQGTEGDAPKYAGRMEKGLSVYVGKDSNGWDAGKKDVHE